MKHKLFPFILCLVLAVPLVQAQSQWESEGDAAVEAGFYKAAVESYQKAMRRQQTPQLTYKLADANRRANNYVEACEWYGALAHSKNAIDFVDLYYYYACMLKQCGEYDSAYSYFNRYLASFPANQELITWSTQAVRNLEWLRDGAPGAQSERVYGLIHEGKNINTDQGESGAVLIGDTMVLFNAMRELKTSGKREGRNDESLMEGLTLIQIYESPVAMNGKPGPSVPNTWGMNSKSQHTSNVAYDPIHNRIFFTRCSADQYNTIPCSIYEMHLRKNKWTKPVRLGGEVNLEGYTNTQPAVAYLPDSTVVLFFVSDRPGGLGGLDIWYTLIDAEGNPSTCINLGQPVNSLGNEITPYYDQVSGRLYFSSDWHYGYGGYDVFYSVGQRDTWQSPVNLGSTLNSPANDLYFSVNQGQPNNGYLTSNRADVANGSTCCNDIYRWKSKAAPQPKQEEPSQPVIAQRKGEVHRLLPISLYFDNDVPDPKSESYTTTATYFQTYNRYMFRRQAYKKAFASVTDSVQRDSLWRAVDYFFDHDVHDNCVAFEEFINLLIDDLSAGRRVSMTVEGYASPVHSSLYNIKISRRRVTSVVNQLLEYDHGRLRRFLSSQRDTTGSLVIREVAYGSSKAKAGVSQDRTNAQRSVYSVEASRERRIEIQDYQYLEDDSTLMSCLRIPNRAQHIGTFFVGETADVEVHLQHDALLEQSLDFISVSHPDCKVISYSRITPGRDLIVYLRMDNRKATPLPSGFIPLTVRVKGESVTQTMFLEYSLVQ